ncbi:hypothetical protein B0T26DRAFT_744980 [Lasiosphaeria miniovina]|uniref:Baeyer-Villiger monooxygenase n=1 Tax=Lasiosphaeria miniovina TaxID=1954250 RepID=A0AA39ZR25_9PEZI|nr:uncharacterized protein B0T26DRAFT_744980 [Lasiosphaeria miniovina]KAK0702119.1 hypothetical protein B0T26DRAFT_744980 [Lasiosphaeria miniovina]
MASHDDNDGDDTTEKAASYSQFACIGAGFSGIGLGAMLERRHGTGDAGADVRIFERASGPGGVWEANRYPGSACDIPGVLYSFSFAPNPHGAATYPTAAQIRAYLTAVAAKYGLLDPGQERITFNATVQRCEWLDGPRRWRLRVRDSSSNGTVFTHEAQFLFAGTGVLVEPRALDVPGLDAFHGAVMHSARWRDDVALAGKRVVMFGNGCTAAQIVPALLAGGAAHVTQVVRSRHWVVPPVRDSPVLRPPTTAEAEGRGSAAWAARWRWRLQRLVVAAAAEVEFLAFRGTAAADRLNRRRRARAERYIRRTAPAEYHELLVPDFKIGCKRRIFDPGYLRSLHAANVTLTDAGVSEVVPQGIRAAADGTVTEADVIVLANGFETNRFLAGIDVRGRGGESVVDHWAALGGPGAYETVAMSGFPNFFMLQGPNTITGHTSVIMAIENALALALRVIEPVLNGEAAAVEVTRAAEAKYVAQVQRDLQSRTVWSHGGCRSWYHEWNGIIYPYYQLHFWYRCRFPTWSDWAFHEDLATRAKKAARRRTNALRLFKLVSVFGGLLALAMYSSYHNERTAVGGAWSGSLASVAGFFRSQMI